jgi:hypothetical protein
LGTNRIAGTSSPEPERPPDRTVSVANNFSYFSHRGDVSIVFPTPP